MMELGSRYASALILKLIYLFFSSCAASQVAQMVKNPLSMQETQETWVHSLGWEDPLEEEMATDSSFLAW